MIEIPEGKLFHLWDFALIQAHEKVNFETPEFVSNFDLLLNKINLKIRNPLITTLSKRKYPVLGLGIGWTPPNTAKILGGPLKPNTTYHLETY